MVGQGASAAPMDTSNHESNDKTPKVTNAQSPNAHIKDSQDRILRRGDLARILGRKKKLRDHYEGALAKISRNIPIGDDRKEVVDGHDFQYDVDLVLGGKLTKLDRTDLEYTTAEAEGMIGDNRARRKRKPEQTEEDPSTTSTTEKPKPQKKASGKQAKAAAKGAGKKRKAGEAGKGAGSKKSKSAAVDVSAASISANAMDMYERHRREFERSIGRLEKTDQYDFFYGDVPPEFDETYGSRKVDFEEVLSTGNMKETQSNDQSQSTESNAPEKPQNENEIIFPESPAYNFHILRKRMEHGRYVLDLDFHDRNERYELMLPYYNSVGRRISKPKKKKKPSSHILHHTAVNWDLFRKDLVEMCDAAIARNPDENTPNESGTLGHTVVKIKEAMDQIYEKTAQRHILEMTTANDRHRFTLALKEKENASAAMQGKWRRHAYPERKYERLRTDAVCSGLSELDERIALYELRTSLPDSFVGLSYVYDDTGQSEGWMKRMMNDSSDQEQQAASALASDDGVIKAQVAASMQSLLIAVQDRAMTQSGVLDQKELKSANWSIPKNGSDDMDCDQNADSEIMEQEVWGMDCYTRKNISISLGTEFDEDTILIFIEKWLLPAINACPKDIAHNLSNAARLLEGLPFDPETSILPRGGSTNEEWRESLLGKALLTKIASSSPPWLKAAATLLRRARDCLGPDFFRIHPKGHGSIVLCPKIEPNRLVTFYRGEVYPSWRWGEKMDAIDITQERKGLKPTLPDFFNMALERPQMDPRGYGLLFVDASRKSGYGSMLSHSCQPTCEVRVAAVNGRLTLAMTTLREMHMGDELTFDYNAVTESLNEYQSAVCLCGHGQCRGSFLHFATADCYQEVLNRNAPITVRLANLIRGCMKRVMSDDDEKLLKSHGFQTAAFGAVSVNRRIVGKEGEADVKLDSMEFVPIWLRTFVADTLRYIEYERRALPISLLSTSSSKNSSKAGDKDSKEKVESKQDKTNKIDTNPEDEKPVKGAKPEPAFFFFLRSQRDEIEKTLKKKASFKNLVGLELRNETARAASALWKEMDEAKKKKWKDRSTREWEKNGGKEKARLEKERLKRVGKGTKKAQSSIKSKKDPKQEKQSVSSKKKGKGAKEDAKPVKEEEPKIDLSTPKLSFQAADAEGISAMEQRIQQLTQTLSRVGRVLDRHRENVLSSAESSNSAEAIADSSNVTHTLREVVHTPMDIMPDEHIIAWMWNHEEGVVKTLVRLISKEVCVSPDMKKAIHATYEKYKFLEEFGTPWLESAPAKEFPVTPQSGKQKLMAALLEFRMDLINGMKDMAEAIKDYKAEAKKEKETARKEADSIQGVLRDVMNDMLNQVERRFNGASTDDQASGVDNIITSESVDGNDSADLPLWLQHYNKRFRLQKAADLLLMYAKTSTYFSLQPYKTLKSTPIEVYARELGNEVPRTAIDEHLRKEPEIEVSTNKKENELTFQEASLLTNPRTSHTISEIRVDEADDTEKAKERVKLSGPRLCEPEDIITEVAVEYQGDYVLSQLLQWYNAGIGQKPGLPDMLGCILLPPLDGCFAIDTTRGSNSRTDVVTGYQKTSRPRLAEWLKDPVQRGGPWPDEVRRAFVPKEFDSRLSSPSIFTPFGSPVLDFFVTGDDSNIMSILDVIGTKSKGSDDEADDFLTSVDHGRPAQAVSNWVQCENPDCLKWRKLPWHVDVDTLGEQFFCKDNIWNPNHASCDAPADEWDESQDAQVAADGSVPIVDAVAKPEVLMEVEESKNTFKLTDFVVGAKFDVLRAFNNKWYPATVTNVDYAGEKKQVKFHYASIATKMGEWVDAYSPRIAPLHTITKPRPKKMNKKSKSKTASTQKKDDQNSVTSDTAEDIQKSLPPSEANSIADADSSEYASHSVDSDLGEESSEEKEKHAVEAIAVQQAVQQFLKKKNSREEEVDDMSTPKPTSTKENTSTNHDEPLHMSKDNTGQLVVGGRIPKKASPPKKKDTNLLLNTGVIESNGTAPDRIPRKLATIKPEKFKPLTSFQYGVAKLSSNKEEIARETVRQIKPHPPSTSAHHSSVDRGAQDASRNARSQENDSNPDKRMEERFRRLEERLSFERKERSRSPGFGGSSFRGSSSDRHRNDGHDDRYYRSSNRSDHDYGGYSRSRRSPEPSRDEYYRSDHRGYTSRPTYRDDGYSEYDDSYNEAYRRNEGYSYGDQRGYDYDNRQSSYDGYDRAYYRHADYDYEYSSRRDDRYRRDSPRYRSRSRERHDNHELSSNPDRRRRGDPSVERSGAQHQNREASRPEVCSPGRKPPALASRS